MQKRELIKELKENGMSAGLLVLKSKQVLILYREKFKLLKIHSRCMKWREI